MKEDPTFAIEINVPKTCAENQRTALLWPGDFHVTQPSRIFSFSSMPLLSSSLLKSRYVLLFKHFFKLKHTEWPRVDRRRRPKSRRVTTSTRLAQPNPTPTPA